MPTWTAPSRAIEANISPLPTTISLELGQPSSSKHSQIEISQASPKLWDVLRESAHASSPVNGHADHQGGGEEEYLCVAVRWPEERRLRAKGKARSTVLWVKPCEKRVSGLSN